MNRLVIIGNGFDLAHGLPTSYRNFIDDYWIGIKSKFDIYSNNSNYEDEFVKIDYKFDSRITVFHEVVPQVKTIKGFNDFKNFIAKYSRESSQDIYNESVIIFKNKIFKNICEMHSIQNWVDVENEYYRQLKKIIHREFPSYTQEGKIMEKKKRVEELNKEFEEVKNLYYSMLKNLSHIY